MPGELAIIQNQALECSLQNVTTSDANKRLKELEGKEVLVMVEEVDNSRFVYFFVLNDCKYKNVSFFNF